MSTNHGELRLQIVATLRSIAQQMDTSSRELWVQQGVSAPQIGLLRFFIVCQGGIDPCPLRRTVRHETGHGGQSATIGDSRTRRSKKEPLDHRNSLLRFTEEGAKLAPSLPILVHDQCMEPLTALVR
jgi:hypothetical protein